MQWSGQRGSNPRPQPWQGCALPTEPCPPARKKYTRFPPPMQVESQKFFEQILAESLLVNINAGRSKVFYPLSNRIIFVHAKRRGRSEVILLTMKGPQPQHSNLSRANRPAACADTVVPHTAVSDRPTRINNPTQPRPHPLIGRVPHPVTRTAPLRDVLSISPAQSAFKCRLPRDPCLRFK